MGRISDSFIKVKGRVFRSRRCLLYSVMWDFKAFASMCALLTGAFIFPGFRNRSLGPEADPSAQVLHSIWLKASRRGPARTNGAASFAQLTAPLTPLSPLSASSISTQFGSPGLGENGESFTRRSPWQIRSVLKGSTGNIQPQNLIRGSRLTKCLICTHGNRNWLN